MSLEPDILERKGKDALRQAWDRITRARGKAFRKLKNAAAQVFRDQGAETVEKILANELAGSGIASASLVFDLEEMSEIALGRLSPAFASAIESGFLFANLEYAYGLKYQSDAAAQIIRTVNEKIVGIQDHTLRRLEDMIQDGNAAGLSIREIADSVEGLFDDMARYRAERIAQTSATAGFEKGQRLAIDASGDLSSWLSQRDGDIREAHEEADGQKRKPGESFVVDGEELEFPGDPAGSAGNVINCRCSLIPASPK